MERAYPGHGIISNKNEKLFQAWDKADPVDVWECERASLIAKIQGNVNLVVEQACGRLKGQK
jgi:deoxyribonuclease-1